jgi:hypothetical protein
VTLEAAFRRLCGCKRAHSGGEIAKEREMTKAACSVVYLCVSIIACGVVVACLGIAGHLQTSDVRFFLDLDDIKVYFRESGWIIDGGTLYVDVFLEYPLLANAIFAAVRYLSETVSHGSRSFYYSWVLAAGAVYALATIRIAAFAPWLGVAAWLAPASIYFALFRYDIYPAAATLFALLTIRRESYVAAALWLGIAIALKGYALFVLPALCAFVLHRRGLVFTVYFAILATLPMILSLAVVYGFAGWDGVAAPFRFHLGRSFNGESSYDALNYVLGTQLEATEIPFVPTALQIATAIAAAALRPRSFDELANAMTFAILGSITFSTFYSPQFLLWILPIVSFANSRMMAVLALLLAWVTYAYFPVAWDLANTGASSKPLHALVIAVTAIRVSMMILAVRNLRPS